MAASLKEKGQSSIALALGMTGGILGIIAGLIVMLFGGAGLLIAPENGGTLLGFGVAAVILGIAGGAGGLITSESPEIAAVVMGIAGVAGFVAATVFWILPGLLLVVGAGFAWASRSEQRRATAAR